MDNMEKLEDKLDDVRSDMKEICKRLGKLEAEVTNLKVKARKK